MTYPQFQWRLPATDHPPIAWQRDWRQWAATLGLGDPFVGLVGQLLWQRGEQDLAAIRGWLHPADYVPTSPWAFGAEMEAAIARLLQAHTQGEKVAIWGDFDADGLTATAVLWEGLGQFFVPEVQLRYYVPNRFTESHGLSVKGLDDLAAWGCTLIVTCDTGSTAHRELAYAHTLGMETIVTDHHTLPDHRPPVVALINPRQLPRDHPLRELSGVAVAYKLMEALYERSPAVPQQPLTTLLDLVAIGLIADLVALRGDCRYLTQRGLQQLEEQAKAGIRPGIAKLLELCKRTGDRPSDIAFGLGPRINAVSRIHGDARFGVELLTSRDGDRAATLAFEAELANTRRQELQATVLHQAQAQLAQLDLSTTQIIILSDPQWSPGVLGLVASQIAQAHGRPTILFQTETIAQPGQPPMARGSARSVNQIDLYDLVKAQAHLLTSFGGHPLAAGMSLPVEHLPLFAAGLNRAVRSQLSAPSSATRPPLAVDAEITVADLGKDLFKALKFLEPYGMGNPIPRFLLKNVTVENLWEAALKDKRGGKQRYYKLTFDLTDPQTGVSFPGHWWGKRRSDLPAGRYDLVVELDVNTYKRQYEARVIDLAPAATIALPPQADQQTWLIDQRAAPGAAIAPPAVVVCPADWAEVAAQRQPPQPLTLAYPPPRAIAPAQSWQQLIGLAKYLARTGESCARSTLQTQLGLSDRTLDLGLQALVELGFGVQQDGAHLRLIDPPTAGVGDRYEAAAHRFISALQEEQFRRQYFSVVPAATLQQVLEQRDSLPDPGAESPPPEAE